MVKANQAIASAGQKSQWLKCLHLWLPQVQTSWWKALFAKWIYFWQWLDITTEVGKLLCFLGSDGFDQIIVRLQCRQHLRLHRFREVDLEQAGQVCEDDLRASSYSHVRLEDAISFNSAIGGLKTTGDWLHALQLFPRMHISVLRGVNYIQILMLRDFHSLRFSLADSKNLTDSITFSDPALVRISLCLRWALGWRTSPFTAHDLPFTALS